MRRHGINYFRSALPLLAVPAAVTLVFFIIIFVSTFKGAEFNKRVYSAESLRLAESMLAAELDFTLRKISLILDYYTDIDTTGKSTEEIKQIVLTELTDFFILRPAFDRINVFEKLPSSSDNLHFKTLLNEELELEPELGTDKVDEIFQSLYTEYPIIHSRTDPVFDRKTKVLTVIREFPEWNWVLTKSHFFEYESLYIEQDYGSLPVNESGNKSLIITLTAGALVYLLTLLAMLRDRRLTAAAGQISEKRLSRLYEYNKSLKAKIKDKSVRIDKYAESKKKAEQRLDVKTKEYKNMNELLIAENMERLQQDRVLRAEKEKAEAANLMKREFLTNTSEKLKVMVSGIKELSEYGSRNFEELDGQEIADTFAELHRSGDELMNILGLIIELSRLEAGRTEDKIALIDFHELFTKASYDTIPLFAETDSRLDVSFSGENLRIRTRYRHIELALLHLLSAAAKNCARGSRAKLKYFQSKSLIAGAMVNSVTLELSSEGFGSDFSLTAVREGSENTKTSVISINIFIEALKRIGGSFTQKTENGLHRISVVIPDLGEPRD